MAVFLDSDPELLFVEDWNRSCQSKAVTFAFESAPRF